MIDPQTLAPGQRIVTDYSLVRHSAPDVSEARTRDRVAKDEQDYGRVYAWDGRVIGRAIAGRKSGVRLDYTWPEDLALEAPATSTAR